MTIDLRSDTVTRPTAAMRDAMASAEVGDDVYGEDPTVNRLQSRLAGMLGMDAGLFVPSGTQGNLLALLSCCERGDEYIAGQDAHVYRYEGGGAAVLGSIQPQPVDFADDGTLDLGRVAAVIKPHDSHFARTRLLCLENTQAGRALPLDYLARVRAFAEAHELALHLDGARLFNAAVCQGVPPADIVRHVDSVSVCLSKGLGAPAGSVLCGSRTLIDKARRWRQVLGGGMRQAGVLAAAGLFALDRHVDRLAEDHANAARLASGLAAIAGLSAAAPVARSNMVFVDVGAQAAGLQAFAAAHDIVIGAGSRLRLVTHLDVSAPDVERVISVFGTYFDD
ncbi:MAG TPA: low-specificity L-threonine aldolase [Woeseiaceae bacterium]|nr:low-specificity L-threonine aldolase [Woeseiaceae bacterium]